MNEKEMLQKAQELLGLNQKELGVYIGVSIRTINSWMTGDRECPMHVAEMTYRLAQEDRKHLDNDESTTGMFRWAVIDEKRNGDEYITVCGSKADALREAQSDWDHLLPKEREQRERFEVGLIHVSLTDQTYDGSHFGEYDENGRIDADVYEVAKDWLK